MEFWNRAVVILLAVYMVSSTTSDNPKLTQENSKKTREHLTESNNLKIIEENTTKTADFLHYTVVDDSNKPKEDGKTVDKIFLDDAVYLNVTGPVKEPLESTDLLPGKIAAILAGVFVLVSIIGYVVMLSWRRYLENRYGNREMLVEDDYCNKRNSFEQFSMSNPTDTHLNKAEMKQMSLLKLKMSLDDQN